MRWGAKGRSKRGGGRTIYYWAVADVVCCILYVSFKPTDVKALRATLAQSQAEFALMIGMSVATLRNWEQGRRTPDGPTLALLHVAAHDPAAAAVEALHRPLRRNAA